MLFRVVVEDMEPNHWIAWVLDLPGCFSSSKTEIEAEKLAPERIKEYFTWLASHNETSFDVIDPIDIKITETFHSFPSKEDPEYIVNAFFEDDRKPLGYWDIETGIRLLNWTRQDLNDIILSISSDHRLAEIPGEIRGSINGILAHIAGAENWYFSHLHCALPREQLSNDPLERLIQVRQNTITQLPKQIGNDRITSSCDEQWSARKVLRRTLWHERDHTDHIRKLLSGLS